MWGCSFFLLESSHQPCFFEVQKFMKLESIRYKLWLELEMVADNYILWNLDGPILIYQRGTTFLRSLRQGKNKERKDVFPK